MIVTRLKRRPKQLRHSGTTGSLKFGDKYFYIISYASLALFVLKDTPMSIIHPGHLDTWNIDFAFLDAIFYTLLISPNLDWHCSTRLEPPDPLMVQKGRFWPFWTLLGHISGQNGWNKSGAHCAIFPLSNKSCFKWNKFRPILKCQFGMRFPKIFVLTCFDQSNQGKC